MDLWRTRLPTYRLLREAGKDRLNGGGGRLSLHWRRSGYHGEGWNWRGGCNEG